MDFKTYKILKEAKSDTLKNKLYFKNLYMDKLDSKDIELNYHKIKVEKIHNNNTDYYSIQITSQLDPNIKGFVQYETQEDVDLAYENLKGKGYVVDYMFRNSKDVGSAMNWGKIVVDEIKAINDPDYSPEKVNVVAGGITFKEDNDNKDTK